MCRLNSSRALMTLHSFVSIEIPQHMAWVWTLLLAPHAHAQSKEQDHPCSQHCAGFTALRGCPGNSPPAPPQAAWRESKQDSALFLETTWLVRSTGCAAAWALGSACSASFCPVLISSAHALPSVYTWHGAKSRWLAGLTEPGSSHTVTSRLYTHPRKKYWFCWK